jgi:hypothetical protein
VREDPKNGLTHQIGYGHSITVKDPLFGKTITEQQAFEVLIKDIKKFQA